MWQQFTPPADNLAAAFSILGDHWLGMDVGEQDGRYVGGYASQMYPASVSRKAQHLNFARHFRSMESILGNRVSGLTSLSFGHYMVKSGTYTGLV